MQVSAFLVGISFVLFGLSHWLPASLLLMACAGYCLMQCASGVNTMIQSLVSEEMRARTMSYYTMAFYGSAPVGSLLAGALAHWIGAPYTVVLTGACCAVGALWFTLHLPRIHAAMQTAAEPAQGKPA
jgi:MFS family permease